MVLTGALSLIAGVLVLIGWHTGQIVSPGVLLFDSVPVRYNTGICFVLGGTSLLLLSRFRIGWACNGSTNGGHWAAHPLRVSLQCHSGH